MLTFNLLAVLSLSKCNDSVTFSFLFSFFFIKDQIASFQLKEIGVFELIFPSVLIILLIA